MSTLLCFRRRVRNGKYEEVVGYGNTFVIDPIEHSDEGEYACIASNSAKTLTASAYLDVRPTWFADCTDCYKRVNLPSGCNYNNKPFYFTAQCNKGCSPREFDEPDDVCSTESYRKYRCRPARVGHDVVVNGSIISIIIMSSKIRLIN